MQVVLAFMEKCVRLTDLGLRQPFRCLDIRYQLDVHCTCMQIVLALKITDNLDSIEYNYVKDHMQDYRRRTSKT